MTPDQIKHLRTSFGWTCAYAANKFGISPQTWRSWEKEDGPTPMNAHLIRLKALYKFQFGKEVGE